MGRITREIRERWPLLTVLETEEIGSQGVHMKGFLLRLFRWACHASTRDFCPASAALVGHEQYRTLFHFICPHRPEGWAVSRAGSLVSYYVSLRIT